jgi:hypothetical protein
MHQVRRKLPAFVGAAALASMFMGTGVVTAAAAPLNATCAGGSVAAGTYRSLTITGFCNVDSGNVKVKRNLTIAPGGGLNAAFSGSDLSIRGDLVIKPSGLVILGCEPSAFPCFNDPNGSTGGTPGYETNHTVRGDMIAKGATLVLVHHNTIWGEVSQTGGGGGLPCVSLFPQGPPAYTTYEDNKIHDDVTVSGLNTCWSGFFRNTVWGEVNWNHNTTWDGTPEPPGDPSVHGDEDGNEIANNTIYGDLNCFHNMPVMQFGDSAGTPSTVYGDARGQCVGPLVIQKDD